MSNNYIIDLKSCYLPTVNEWQMLLDAIGFVKRQAMAVNYFENQYPNAQFVYYRGNQLVIFTNGFYAHIFKEEVTGYVVCKITDSKQSVHLEIEKEMANMLTEIINRNKEDLSPEPKITRQSHPYLPPNE